MQELAMAIAIFSMFISFFFLVLSEDCAELLNAGVRKTGVYTLIDRSWIIPFYCDQDYKGGGMVIS